MKLKILPPSVLGLVKRNRHLYRVARRVRGLVGRALSPWRLDGVPGRVHLNDFMLDSVDRQGAERYLASARTVMSALERALDRAGRAFDSGTWLDYGCGYGRVVRLLVQRMPSDRIWVTDINREGVEFCASEFGVHRLFPPGDLRVTGQHRFDFIFAISVLTHLGEKDCRGVLEDLGNALAPGGVLLFTTHGSRALAEVESYGPPYAERRDAIAAAVARTGIAYEPYAHYPDAALGMTWHTVEWVRDAVRRAHEGRLVEILFEAGTLYRQDVFAYQRRVE